MKQTNWGGGALSKGYSSPAATQLRAVSCGWILQIDGYRFCGQVKND